MPATAAKPKYTLGAWGRKLVSGDLEYLAPVYNGDTHHATYWVTVDTVGVAGDRVDLWRVRVTTHNGEQVESKLKETATLAKGWAERWVEAL